MLETSRIGPLLVALAAALAAGCGDPEPAPAVPDGDSVAPTSERSPLAVALTSEQPIVVADAAALTTAAGARLRGAVNELAESAAQVSGGIVVDYPFEGSVFPPGFVPPTFLWHDDATTADAWLVRIDFAGVGEPVLSVVGGPPPEQGWIDRRAIGDTNELYEPTEYQASAHAWTPPPAVWEAIQERSVDAPVTVSFAGLAEADSAHAVSRGAVTISTSRDEVGAPIFYRDVPLMPSVADVDGKIKPLAQDAMPLIEWRMRDVTRPESKLVLTGMRQCANCHSFSRDGKRMGMDVDGPTGDKGAYALLPISKQLVIDDDHVISWNSFSGKPAGKKTIGFLARVSPDGLTALTTLNESVYVANFANYRFLQVFYPTRGILAWASAETHEMKALPGADDPDLVQCNGVWTPDGKTIVFCRAPGFEAPMGIETMARYPNDEREPKIQYDLYRMPFDEGRGGTPTQIEGASANGMSNTFPKVSPDGRWIIFTKCKNGLLMRPDGRLWIVPVEGGTARELSCNLPIMNSWHSFSPNGRWLCFTSKSFRPYTQLFLTHLDEDGNDTPAILVPNCTAANRAVNLPEFLNAPLDAIDDISVPAGKHNAFIAYYEQGTKLLDAGHFAHAVKLFDKAVTQQPDVVLARLQLAHALRGSGQEQRAAEQYENVLAIQPFNPVASGGLEMLRDHPTPDGRSVEQLRAALDADPQSVTALRAFGLAIARANVMPDGAAALSRALAQDPDDAIVRHALAHLLLRTGHAKDAVPHLRTILSRTPDDARTRIILSWLRAASPDPDVRDPLRAVQNARIACRVTEYQDARAVEALAAAYAASGVVEDAVEMQRLAVRLAQRDRPALVRWARIRLALYERGGRPGD